MIKKLWAFIVRCRDCNDDLITNLLTQIQELKIVHNYQMEKLEKEIEELKQEKK